MKDVIPRKKIYGAVFLLVGALFGATLLMAQPSPDVSLEVVLPNGGEFWGGHQVIMWNSSDVQKVDIWFSGDNGTHWIPLAQDVDSLSNQLHLWGWDTSLVNDTTHALINISSRFGYGLNETQGGGGYGDGFNPNLYFDVSNAPFTVDNTPPVIGNISAYPLIQEASDNVTLSATINDNQGIDDVILSIEFPDSHWENIPLPRNQTGDLYRYNWPYRTVGLYNYSFLATDLAGILYQSPWNTFLIEDTIDPTIDLRYPQGGDFLSGEVTILYNITDNSDASFNDSIDIEYSTDDGTTWHILAENLYNTGYYYWNTTQFNDGTTYRIRINATDLGGNWAWGQTNTAFTLDNTPPQVVLKTPLGGDILNDLATITWEARDNITQELNLLITLSYSPDIGESWTPIVQNISNTGLYVHNIQHWIDNKTYLFRINATDETGNTGIDTTIIPLIKDNQPPYIRIARPQEGWLHLFGERLIRLQILQFTVVIGRITVEIDAHDHNVTDIGRIDISVDNIFQETLWEEPYAWEWPSTLGKHTLTATAHDYAGNHATTTQEIITIPFPH